MKYSIVIPCYNEADNLESLVNMILPITEEHDVEFVLVENGSKDNSRDVFFKKIDGHYDRIKVVYVTENRGYGYGVQKGIEASSGEYIGWIHADLQISPSVLKGFFAVVDSNNNGKLFVKGHRKNRSHFDRFFTLGQSIFNTILFGIRLYDVGAIPVLAHKSLFSDMSDWANDFSFELSVYVEAKRRGFVEKRIDVSMGNRENGKSSWNKGFKSKIRQSRVIFRDSILIRKGKKVV